MGMGNLGEKASRTGSFLSCCPTAAPMEEGGNGRAQCPLRDAGGSRRAQCHPPHPSLMLRSPLSASPEVILAHCCGPGWFWALLFAPSSHRTYNVGQGMGGPAAKPDVMLSLCHLWACSASISQKGREGEGGQNFPSPFGAGSPARTVMGKASRVGEASEREEPVGWGRARLRKEAPGL